MATDDTEAKTLYIYIYLDSFFNFCCFIQFFDLFLSQVRLTLGMYFVFLLDWLTVFHREQILVLRLEDYAANLKRTIKTVFEFLSVGMYLRSIKKQLHMFKGKHLFKLLKQKTCIALIQICLPFPSQALCQSKWRQLLVNGPCPTPGGSKTRTSVQCFQPPETSSAGFTCPSTVNCPVY